MKRRSLVMITAAAIALAATTAGLAESFTLSNGETREGTLYKILDQQVWLQQDEERVSVPMKDFDRQSKKAIKDWANENPHLVDVYTKWDAQPVIKSSVMPRVPVELHKPEFKGMVSVDLVLDEMGKVMHASIKKATHAELEAPSLEAARTWLFEPAKVSGKAVRSKLRVPFKFTYTPPAPPVEESVQG